MTQRTYAIYRHGDTDQFHVRWRIGKDHRATPEPVYLSDIRRVVVEFRSKGYQRILCVRT